MKKKKDVNFKIKNQIATIATQINIYENFKYRNLGY